MAKGKISSNVFRSVDHGIPLQFYISLSSTENTIQIKRLIEAGGGNVLELELPDSIIVTENAQKDELEKEFCSPEKIEKCFKENIPFEECENTGEIEEFEAFIEQEEEQQVQEKQEEFSQKLQIHFESDLEEMPLEQELLSQEQNLPQQHHHSFEEEDDDDEFELATQISEESEDEKQKDHEAEQVEEKEKAQTGRILEISPVVEEIPLESSPKESSTWKKIENSTHEIDETELESSSWKDNENCTQETAETEIEPIFHSSQKHQMQTESTIQTESQIQAPSPKQISSQINTQAQNSSCKIEYSSSEDSNIEEMDIFYDSDSQNQHSFSMPEKLSESVNEQNSIPEDHEDSSIENLIEKQISSKNSIINHQTATKFPNSTSSPTKIPNSPPSPTSSSNLSPIKKPIIPKGIEATNSKCRKAHEAIKKLVETFNVPVEAAFYALHCHNGSVALAALWLESPKLPEKFGFPTWNLNQDTLVMKAVSCSINGRPKEHIQARKVYLKGYSRDQ